MYETRGRVNPVPTDPPRRTRLSRDRVLVAAMAVADEHGLNGLTIRSLAERLGSTPMALYHHVRNKEEVLDGIVDVVFSEIDLPRIGGDWRVEMRRRADSARAVLRRHPWSIGLLESRAAPGPAILRHHDATIGTLRVAGFSISDAAHVYAVLDSFVYGFALQEAGLPFDGPEDVVGFAEDVLEQIPVEDYPWLAEMTTEHVMQPGYDFGDEFAIGLELILDAFDPDGPGGRPARTVP